MANNIQKTIEGVGPMETLLRIHTALEEIQVSDHRTRPWDEAIYPIGDLLAKFGGDRSAIDDRGWQELENFSIYDDTSICITVITKWGNMSELKPELEKIFPDVEWHCWRDNPKYYDNDYTDEVEPEVIEDWEDC